MYYLWKDKKSTPEKVLVYLTDYNEKNKEGKVKIDGYGYCDVELLYSNTDKMKCIEYAQNNC